ncbi:histidine phosphatase family protein [Paenibacillus albiflavus]|uniref:Histidine phosphatase family protein n=1 Tax=Paenibacillus albiflavus TaxID=2545760 RepID=A0A4R4EM01_9BACL|nr:histidine phosphatase family protein [Paenibacillus albiflavus]TCZ79491.1 histidine phosphatase family protein [Paenibacillus albiflavus]
MTQIGFVRHGSTSWNKEGRAQGSSDIPLDEEGMMQASKLAERLRHEQWDYIYSSDLLRARQTAETIGERLGIHVVTDSRLREVGGGLIEGTTEPERIEKWGADWRALDLGIEKIEVVASRGRECIEEIVALYPNAKILVVSHGGFIQCMLKTLLSDYDGTGKIGNTSVTTICSTDSGWTCELFNCTKHI